jgi:hypothetical protein
MDDYPDNEIITELITKDSQATKVILAHVDSGLCFHANNLTCHGLEDKVNFLAVARSPMVNRCVNFRPSQLAADFPRNECFKQLTTRAALIRRLAVLNARRGSMFSGRTIFTDSS